MASRKRFAHTLQQVRRGVLRGYGFQRGDDVDGGVAGPRGSGNAAGEVDEVGQVACVGDEDDFEGFGGEVAGLGDLKELLG